MVQDGRLYGRDPIFAVITKAAALSEATKYHDIQKNEYIVQLGQVMIITHLSYTFHCCFLVHSCSSILYEFNFFEMVYTFMHLLLLELEGSGYCLEHNA